MPLPGKAFISESDEQDYVLAGQQNLLSDSSYVKMSQLQKLFGAFTEKQQILGILDQCLQTDGVQMYIGEESGYEEYVVIMQFTFEGGYIDRYYVSAWHNTLGDYSLEIFPRDRIYNAIDYAIGRMEDRAN